MDNSTAWMLIVVVLAIALILYLVTTQRGSVEQRPSVTVVQEVAMSTESTNFEQGQLTIHAENLLPIIKKWLYSEKEIFLRELVSNAFDAITKARHARFPLAVLHLAGALEGRAEVRVIDGNLDRDYVATANANPNP